LDKSEFERIVHIGLGRAILHLQTHDSAPYRDVLLHACTHDTVYDQQVEGTKARYIYDLLHLTNDFDFYRRATLNALAQTQDRYREIEFLLDFTRMFAEDGDKEARQALYDKYRSNLDQGQPTGGTELVILDGIEGFIFAIAPYGEPPDNSKIDMLNADLLLSYLEDRDGEEATALALDKACLEYPKLAAFIYELRQMQIPPGSRRSDWATRWKKEGKRYRNMSYEDVRRTIIETAGQKGARFSYMRWGEMAGDDDLRAAAADLLLEQDEDRLLAYLQIFAHRAFPLAASDLINIVRRKTDAPTYRENGRLSKADEVTHRALQALENVSHPDVRAFAFERMQLPYWKERALGLLARNLEADDWPLITALTAEKLDDSRYHDLGWSVRDIFEVNPSPDAVPALLNIYEYGPCNRCRESVVESLHSLEMMPDWMIEESKHDSNLDLREWVANGFKRAEH
jgi:hypothetical protein